MTSLAPQPGLVAVGDSITRGTGTSALNLPCQSWALWLAQALELPFTGLAQDGATVADIAARQLPRVRHAYAVGAIYAGVNDVRSVAFDLGAFETGLEAVCAHVATHATRTVLCTIPLDLGRPRAGAAKVQSANAAIREAAARHGAAVADLSDLSGPTRVLPDAVHLTALGQLEVADRAAAALGVDPLPSAGQEPACTPRALARFALTGHLPALARDLRRRGVEALQRRAGYEPGSWG